MSRIAHMLAAWRPRQEAWLAVARGLVAGDGPGIRALGSAISAPLACVVAGAALASIASSDGVDDTRTRITAQSFIPVEIGRAHVCTHVTNATRVCRLLLEKTNIINT